MSVKVGNVEIMPLLDSNLLGDPDFFLPRAEGRFAEEYPHLVDERKLVKMSITCFLVRSSGKTVLVDSGLGNRAKPGFPPAHLDKSMSEAGIRPEDIDIVVHTHLHIDHVGWNTVDGTDGKPSILFTNATFVTQQSEYDYWMTPERMAEPGNAHLIDCVKPVADAGKLKLVEGDAAITEDLVFVPAPGHTPGHAAVGIASSGERAIIIGDASHHVSQLDHPDWSTAFDIDPDQAHRTRDKIFDEVADDGRLFVAGHWQHPGMGRIVRLDGRRVFQAL